LASSCLASHLNSYLGALKCPLPKRPGRRRHAGTRCTCASSTLAASTARRRATTRRPAPSAPGPPCRPLTGARAPRPPAPQARPTACPRGNWGCMYPRACQISFCCQEHVLLRVLALPHWVQSSLSAICSVAGGSHSCAIPDGCPLCGGATPLAGTLLQSCRPAARLPHPLRCPAGRARRR